jgi:hypothetical protein
MKIPGMRFLTRAFYGSIAETGRYLSPTLQPSRMMDEILFSAISGAVICQGRVRPQRARRKIFLRRLDEQ